MKVVSVLEHANMKKISCRLKQIQALLVWKQVEWGETNQATRLTGTRGCRKKTEYEINLKLMATVLRESNCLNWMLIQIIKFKFLCLFHSTVDCLEPGMEWAPYDFSMKKTWWDILCCSWLMKLFIKIIHFSVLIHNLTRSFLTTIDLHFMHRKFAHFVLYRLWCPGSGGGGSLNLPTNRYYGPWRPRDPNTPGCSRTSNRGCQGSIFFLLWRSCWISSVSKF